MRVGQTHCTVGLRRLIEKTSKIEAPLCMAFEIDNKVYYLEFQNLLGLSTKGSN
jgi:hypothetical protein